MQSRYVIRLHIGSKANFILFLLCVYFRAVFVGDIAT